MEKEREFTSKSGVKVYCYKNPALHGFYISLFVRAGMLYEREDEVGITHFLEHAIIRNVNKLYGMKLYSELDKRGLEFNASTFSEMVQFYVGGSSEEFRFGADVITKALDPLVLTKSEIDCERRRIKAEIRESDEKSSLASFTSKVAFGETPLARSIVGTNKTVDAITGTRLERYRREMLASENVFFYITGSFTEEDVGALLSLIDERELDRGYCRDNVAPVPAEFGKRVPDVHIKSSDFTMARLTFDIDMSRFSIAEIDLLYDVLLSGYNSKLFSELSEKRGLCYDISGGTERYKNVGTFHFSFELKERDLYEAMKITVDILREMKTSPLDADECMKAGYVKNAYMLYDDFRELNFTFAYDNHIMGESYTGIEDRIAKYKSVSAEQIRTLADALFTKENLTLTVKGDKKRIDKARLIDEISRL